jgi:hypothetical protein
MIRGKTISHKEKRMLATNVVPAVMRLATSSLNGTGDKSMKQYA